MELVLAGNSDGLTIKVIGEVVADNCANLRDTVMETVTREPRRVILDMSEVPFIDTSGLGVLVGLRAHLRGRSVTLELTNPSPKVRQVLKMTRLAAVFGVTE